MEYALLNMSIVTLHMQHVLKPRGIFNIANSQIDDISENIIIINKIWIFHKNH